MVKDSNVFIDFEIIKNSSIEGLREELDTIIKLRNKIYVWSKQYTPSEMRKYCLKTKVDTSEQEKELHKECFQLRNVECLSYNEINEKTGVPIKQIGFYAAVTPDKKWTLDDWIVDYHNKDSSMYQKVDFIVDSNERLVERFRRTGIEGNVIDKI